LSGFIPGALRTGDTVLNPRTGKTDRIGRLVKMHANKREDVTEILAGDICACVGLKDLKTGDTLVFAASSNRAGRHHLPGYSHLGGHRAKTKADQEKMGVALSRLADEDPTFKVHTDEDSGQTIISGMGELHLEILVDRMRREHKVEANVGEPKVAFRETIRKKARLRASTFARPAARATTATASCASSPTRRARATSSQRYQGRLGAQGVHQAHRPGRAWSVGVGHLGRLPHGGRQVTLIDGSYHEVDSNEMAFKFAGSIAFKEAARKASPVLLEPVMAVEVTVPEEFMGVIIGDINSRRGRIEAMEHAAGSQVIKAMVPLKEMFGYVNDIRSSTQGRASYSMQFAH